MIVRPHPSAVELLFSCHGSIVPAILPQIIAAAALGAVAAFLADERANADVGSLFTFTPFTALGVAISLFLGSRNNAAYARWWEGRRQWGAQLIAVRNLGRLLSALQVPDDDRRALVRLSVAHAHATRAQLRAAWRGGRRSGGALRGRRGRTPTEPADGADLVRERDGCLEPDERAAVAGLANPADGILGLAAARLGAMHRREGGLDSVSTVAVTQHLDILGTVQGGAERIATTPLPYAYQLLVHRTAYLYVLLAPFAMAEEMGWFTPLFNAIIAYTFFGLDELSRQLASPFGEEPQCLALSAICRTIEISAAEALGDPAPAPLTPDDKYNLM